MGTAEVKVKTLKRIFFWPSMLGVLTLVGLVGALIKDGLIEYLALSFLSVPIIVTFYFNLVKQ